MVSVVNLFSCERIMSLNVLNWYCQPIRYGIWASETQSAFGAYTPCGIDSFVISVSHLVLLILCLYRIWLITRDVMVQRFCLRSNVYNYVLGVITTYCTAEPLFRLGFGVSLFNLNEDSGFAPFEVRFFSFPLCLISVSYMYHDH